MSHTIADFDNSDSVYDALIEWFDMHARTFSFVHTATRRPFIAKFSECIVRRLSHNNRDNIGSVVVCK